MVGVEGDNGFCFCSYTNRELLAVLVCQIDALSYLQLLRAGKICNLDFKNSIRVWLAVCFFWHQVDLFYFANFHICNSSVKALDHLTGTAGKFQRLTAVIRRIKLGSVIEGSFVMSAADFADIASCDRIHIGIPPLI